MVVGTEFMAELTRGVGPGAVVAMMVRLVLDPGPGAAGDRANAPEGDVRGGGGKYPGCCCCCCCICFCWKRCC